MSLGARVLTTGTDSVLIGVAPPPEPETTESHFVPRLLLSKIIENLRATMKLNVSLLSKVISLAFLALSLGACDKVDTDNDAAKAANAKDSNLLLPDNQIHPTTAMTWDEWVAYDSPNRNGFEDFYHSGKGYPNFSQWTPQDVLPAEVFGHPYRDSCELPKNIRSYLRRTSHSHVDMDVYTLLDLAEQGYAEAQAMLGTYCHGNAWQYVYNPDGKYDNDELAFAADKWYISDDEYIKLSVLPDDKKPVSMRDALYWAQRGAASGNAVAQFGLVQCMYNIDLIQTFHLEDVKHPIKLDAFWYDKLYYWLDQSLQSGLLNYAVEQRTNAKWMYPEPGSPRYDVEYYKWSRLWEIQARFRGIGKQYDEYSYKLRSTQAFEGRLSDDVVAQAEKEVGQWLRGHPDVWRNIYDHSYIERKPKTKLCPGEPGHHEEFDFAWLNKELAQYDVQITPPEKPLIETPTQKEQ